MIRLGIRLATSGGRGALVGLALAAIAVATGTAVLLFALSFRPALDDRAEREAWRSSFVFSESGTSADAKLLVSTTDDEYQGEPIVRVLVAGLVNDPPLPPGLSRLPGPGEALVSPSLAALIAAVPADQLGDRFGTVVGTIGDAALRSPEELVAVVGMTPAALDALGAAPVIGFDPTPKPPEIPPIAVLLIVLAVIGALVPVAVFVSTATRLSAARREQRLAALRLIGATAFQVTRLAVVEAMVVSVIGVVVGIGLFVLVRPLVALVPLDDATWFPNAIQPPLVPAVLLLLAIPVVGAAAAILALRRVVVTPLGVQRRQTPPMPGITRAVPLVIALVALVGVSSSAGRFVSGNPATLLAMGVSFGGVIVGIVLIGPWLTVLVGRALRVLPGGASMLLASRRLTDDPRGSFGAIAGVIMAVFVASAFFTFVGFASNQGFVRAGGLRSDQVFVQMPFNDGPSFAQVPARIAAVPGVRSVLPIASGELTLDDGSTVTAWIGSCPEIARQYAIPAAACGSGRIHVFDDTTITAGSLSFTPDRGDRSPIDVTVTAADVSKLTPAGPPLLGPASVIIDPSVFAGAAHQASATNFTIDTDGSAVTAERVRTAVVSDVATAYVRLASEDRSSSHVYDEFGRVVALGLVGSLILAGCSLAVSVTTSVLERRRQFALLRSAGMPVSRLRAVVLLQAGAPLVVVAIFSAVLGIVVAQVILRLAEATNVPWPNPSLAAVLAVSLAAALGVVALMLPPLERLTRPDSVRVE